MNIPNDLNHAVITATAEDLSGNKTSVSITIERTPDAGGNLADPVQLTATPIAGFSPLEVNLTSQANVPGTIRNIAYDFDGDGVSDFSTDNPSPLKHTYNTPGQFFPTVTIRTDAGTFSSPGGWNSTDPNRLRINVQAPPAQVGSPISITDPIDLKCTTDNKLYILSRSAATIFQYDVSTTPPQLIRSKSAIGATPTGLDVDSAGNVYVALSGDNQVAKFTPVGGSFQLDAAFGNSGKIGTTGTGNGEFQAPYDVAVSPDGLTIAVSDSGNNRIQQFTADGLFVSSFGSLGSGAGQFNSPKGVTYCTSVYLSIVDSGNNRIVLAGTGGLIIDSGGSGGGGLAQFQGPANLSMVGRGTYVADKGNNRVQAFRPPAAHAPLNVDLASVRWAISAGLNQPSAVAVLGDATKEMVYIADTSNGRVLLYSLPTDDPTPVWVAMRNFVVAKDIASAVECFSTESKENYRNALLSSDAVIPAMGSIGDLTLISISADNAVYTFTDTIKDRVITFPVKFTKENGVWKILEF